MKNFKRFLQPLFLESKTAIQNNITYFLWGLFPLIPLVFTMYANGIKELNNYPWSSIEKISGDW